jgi:UDPglucose 6-dehydrogenase
VAILEDRKAAGAIAPMAVSVVGLGKLGAPLVAVVASKGHRVVGVDLDPAVVAAMAAGRAPVDEPGLQELLDKAKERVAATADLAKAVAETDITLIIVPTPSGPDGRFANDHVLSAIEGIGAGLKRKTGYHVVVVTSTVMPGSTGGVVAEALARHSGRAVGREVGLCYSPEFIALGSVIRDMQRPDMILIGESDPRAGQVLERLLSSVVENAAPVRRMNLVNAELTKIAVNTYVTTKIAYANMLGELCERLPGADADVVTAALGMDSRIGGKYLRPATGYGGPCFPRDNVAFAALARGLGARADLAEATDRLNQHQVLRLAELAARHVEPRGRIGVLGLSYKPDTDVVEASQGVLLARALVQAGFRVVVFDPKAMAGARRILGRSVEYAATAAECARTTDALVVATAWPEFRALEPSDFGRGGARAVAIDCWRVLDAARVAPACRVIVPGRGDDHADHGTTCKRAAA